MKPMRDKIIVIGLQRPDESLTLFKISEWLEKHRPGYKDLALCLGKASVTLTVTGNACQPDGVDIYDMATHPEKGDGLDAINGDTAMVVALHLFGVDKLPGGNTARVTEMEPLTCYNRDNIHLLQICMQHGIPLIAVGDQPWLGLEKRTLMYGADPFRRPDVEAFLAGKAIAPKKRKTNEPLVYLYETKGNR